ncbi:hypothetical protein Leryth_003519 [Lithospermum erythrorhizon]|uniref:Uncharacterized protein n=1 Tax=Lithospermum erythrorhizon TaxID=34254 RepID=A0AAV3Q6H6_LITER|nr:hypothetical protein Leryth_003519 [Lithospermum erythrorhizon]
MELLLSSMFSDQYLDFPCPKVEKMCQWLMFDEQEKDEPSQTITEDSSGNSEMDYNEQSIIYHLFKAYSEAIENGYGDLKEVIAKSILEKINPLGDAIERVTFWKFQTQENTSGTYLKAESNQNIEIAFNAFYLSFPYGRFAHFTANAAILESIPNEGVNIVHVVDFDMGDGVQWAPFLEAMSNKGISLRFTSIKFDKQRNFDTPWNSEETKRRLYKHAETCGATLVQIDEMNMEDLIIELKRVKKRGCRNEWTVFNCMISLPHMVGRRRRRKSQAMKFLASAKAFLANYVPRRGIIIIGDGEAHDISNNICSNFDAFFNNRLNHYEVVLESMEKTFPVKLREARILMETLFVAPHICSDSWFEDWKEMKEIQEKFGDDYGLMEACKFSMENIDEARGLVNEENSLFMVRVEGEMDNEMVLEWRGIPLVRISIWT